VIPPPRNGGVTVRAVCIGLCSSIVLNLVMGYNDGYLRNSPMTGNHFPIASMAMLGALVLGVNIVARGWFKVEGLAAGELLLIWGMLGVAGGIGSAGLMRYFPSWVVAPTYYTKATGAYGATILSGIPEELLVSKDLNSPAVTWYMEGLPRGERIPWSRWVMPMGAWFGFVLLLYGVMFALSALFLRQWAEHERLVFPIVHLPVELARAAPAGRFLNEFLSHPVTWMGVVVPVLIHSCNELHEWLPAIPSIKLGWWAGNLFADRPWSEFNLGMARVHFMVLGLTFLLTTQVAFSFWFFYVLYRLSYVYLAWLGAGATGFWGNWEARVTVFEMTGVQIVLAIFLFWAARRFLSAWFNRALAGRRDPVLDPMAPRLALTLIVAGLAGMIAWLLLAGVQWWVAPLAVVLFVAGLLVTTRVVAESGLLFVNNNVVPYDLFTGLVPARWQTSATVNTLLMQKAVVMADAREILMPHLLHGARALQKVSREPAAASERDQHGRRLEKVLAVFAVTAVVAIGISAYARISTGYKYGGVNLDPWSNVWGPNAYLDHTHRHLSTPPTYEWVTVRGTKILPVNVAHVGVGAALAAGILMLQSRFLWWPLHPFGLAMGAYWSTSVIWFSIFLGWLAKASVMTFGGAAAYRRTLPFFLGLVLGEALIAALWMAVSLALGQPGRPIMPG